MIKLFLFFITTTLIQSADHLLLVKVVTQPNTAEAFSIYNPTPETIDLSNYYICDNEDYYKMQTEQDLAPSHIASGFTAKFPNIFINPGDTLNIVLNENYKDFYGEEYSPDLLMFGYENNSMIETTTDPSSFGGSTIN